MKKNIMQKYMQNRDLNNNIVDDESLHQTEPFQNGVLVSSTVSDDFIGLQLIKQECYRDAGDEKKIFAMPLKRSYSSDSDDDVLVIDADYDDDDILEPILKSSGGFNENKRRRLDIEPLLPVKKQKIEAKLQKSASQPSALKTNAVTTLKFSYSQEFTVISSSIGDLDSHLKCLFAQLFHKANAIFSFKMLCPNFLLDNCSVKNCQKSHLLPTPLEFRDRLKSFSIEDVKLILVNIILPYKKLVSKYFCVIAEYFAEKHLKDELIYLIKVCASMRMHSLYAHIIDAFVKMGFSYSQALITLLRYHQINTPKSSLVLLGLIVDRRNENIIMFLDELKTLIDKQSLKFHSVMIEKLIKLSIEKPNSVKLRDVVRKALRQTDVIKLDSKLLSKFTKMDRFKSSKDFRSTKV